jgi:hypothetical protein
MLTRGAARTAYSGEQNCDVQELTRRTIEPLDASKFVCMGKLQWTETEATSRPRRAAYKQKIASL